MGNRPSSTLLYGFDCEAEIEEIEGLYERDRQWEARVFAAAGLSESAPPGEAREWYRQREAALRNAGQAVYWGYLEEPSWAFGFVMASGDWDRAEEVTDLTIPDNADAKLRELAEFYGVEVKPAKMLLLSSYG